MERKSDSTQRGIEEFNIVDVAYRGNGIAKDDGIVTFIPGTLTGERVRARIVADKKRFREAGLVEVVTPSPHRIAPCCRLSDGSQIPGCVYDHIEYEAEVAIKDSQLRNFLRKFSIAENGYLPPFASPSSLGYRNKITLHVQRGKSGEARSGYFGEDNKTVVDIESCPLARSAINYAWAKMRMQAKRTLQDGDTITLRHTDKDAVVSWVNRAPADSPWLTEKFIAGSLTLPPDGFFQVNPEVAMALQEQVLGYIEEVVGDKGTMLDLYCGVGLFALASAKFGFKTIVGIESGRNAITAARRNAISLGINAKFHCETAANAARSGFFGVDLRDSVIVVDPPRHGCEPEVIEAIADSEARCLIYVSCDPSTLTRDLERLTKSGFTIKKARLFDMFPRSYHFESALLLVR